MSQEFFQLLIDGREGLFEFVRMRPCLELSTEPQRGRLSDVANSSGESILQFNTRQNIRSCYSTFSSHKHFAFGLSTAVCIKSFSFTKTWSTCKNRGKRLLPPVLARHSAKYNTW